MAIVVRPPVALIKKHKIKIKKKREIKNSIFSEEKRNSEGVRAYKL